MRNASGRQGVSSIVTTTQATATPSATIVATSITITRAEGPNYLCDHAHVFTGPTCWADANAWLASQAHTFPTTGGYDKHDFVIAWSDGDKYEGRLDCQGGDTCPSARDCDVAMHILSFLRAMAGEVPVGRTQDEWDRYLAFLKVNRADYADFIATHVIPV